MPGFTRGLVMEIQALKITDAHCHFFSHAFYKALVAQSSPSGPVADRDVTERVQSLGLQAPPEDPVQLAAQWVHEMDRHGVHQAVLIASVPPDWQSVAKAIRAYPGRFAGYAMIDPQAPGAVATVQRLFADEGFRGVCFFPAMHRFHVYDPAALQVVEVARQHKGVVFCHFGILRIPIRERLGLSGLFDGTYAVPTDLHRVAADFPSVTFQIPHFGAGYFREVLLLGVQCPNVVVDTSSGNGWIQQVGHPWTLESVFAKTLEVFGPERILWGSDSSVFPRGWKKDIFDVQFSCLRSAGCDEKTLHSIFGGNARRLFF
jgi:predicted TIM-barrel fold metal-dependent hydrolase